MLFTNTRCSEAFFVTAQAPRSRSFATPYKPFEHADAAFVLGCAELQAKPTRKRRVHTHSPNTKQKSITHLGNAFWLKI